MRALLKAGVDVTFHTGEEPPLVMACRLQVRAHGVSFANSNLNPESLIRRPPQSYDLVSMLASALPAPGPPSTAGGGSVVNGAFRCDPPLHVVAQLGCVDMGECLLANGADVNLLSAITGDTPLHRAICYDRSDFIRLLHAHAAEWHRPSRGGVAPFVLASITQSAAALECCANAGVASPAEISSLDLLRVMLAFPSVDTVTAAACSMLLSLWEQGAGQRGVAESLQLQWLGLLLVSSADAGSPNPIVNVLSATLIAICRRSSRSLPPLAASPVAPRICFPIVPLTLSRPQFLRSNAAPVQLRLLQLPGGRPQVLI